MLIYIHGCNSSPAASKAQLVRSRLALNGREHEFLAPALPHSPAAASAMLEGLARAHPQACMIGSSLGGYYATWLAERFGARAVLVNPAVKPYALLRGVRAGQLQRCHISRYVLCKERSRDDQRLYFHELVHVVQSKLLGPERFLAENAAGLETFGYRGSAVEAMAYDAETAFARSAKPLDAEKLVADKLRVSNLQV